VAIQASSPAKLIERAEAVLADSRFLELRLDALANPAAALPKVKEFLAAHRDVTAIATCRRKACGGNFVGSLTAEFTILLAAAEAGCQIVDLEVESAEEAKRAALAKFRDGLRAAGGALLISFHDFAHTKGWTRPPRASRPSGPICEGGFHGQDADRQSRRAPLIEERSLSAQVVASPWARKAW